MDDGETYNCDKKLIKYSYEFNGEDSYLLKSEIVIDECFLDVDIIISEISIYGVE